MTPELPPTRLPYAEHADIDDRKFTAYSMAPENPKNRGKWKAWAALGYDLAERRQEAAADVTRQLRQRLPDAPISKEESTAHGLRRSTWTTVTGPTGRTGTLVVVWQYAPGSQRPRMITHWVRVHQEEGDT